MSGIKDSFPNVVETIGSNGAAVDSFLSFVEENGEDTFLTGDSFSFPGLKESLGLTFISSNYVKRSEDYSDVIEATIRASKAVYGCDNDEPKQKIENDVREWFLQDFEERNKGYTKIMSVECCDIEKSEPDFFELKVTLHVDWWMARNFVGDVKESPFYHYYWNVHMEKIITEGVCYTNNKVPNDLIEKLRYQITDFSQKTIIDYHPNSNDVVRDLVHPGLYPYIHGVSKLKKAMIYNVEASNDSRFDFWGRKYEDSKFQWLPTSFRIDDKGKCCIQDYINNLDRHLFPSLYDVLSELFDLFLPLFEEVWSYCKAIEFFKDEDADDEDRTTINPLQKEKICFNGKVLQVIVKIVDYTLQPGQYYEGVWHAEGMSHENIVMTGIYFLDRSSEISGGDLRFKRAFTVEERSRVFWNIQQSRPYVVNDFASEGFIPLGHFPTSEGYMLVFPNCHIHKISKMINEDKEKAASRRIVVFFFVNPEKEIISTREVAPQQDVISLETAKKYRLELMAERKYDKEKLNVRNIELCEH